MKQRVPTFRDVVFKPHNQVKGGVQGLVKLPNGVTVSIVGGPTLYGDGVDTFEVAAWWDDHGDWIVLGDGEDVKTYQDKDQVTHILFELSKL
jgi:hypothetical protein